MLTVQKLHITPISRNVFQSYFNTIPIHTLFKFSSTDSLITIQQHFVRQSK